jgi:hypothetical protein
MRRIVVPVANGRISIADRLEFRQNLHVEQVIVVEGEKAPDPTPVNRIATVFDVGYVGPIDRADYAAIAIRGGGCEAVQLFAKTVRRHCRANDQRPGSTRRGSSAVVVPPIETPNAALSEKKIGRDNVPLDKAEASAMHSAIPGRYGGRT